MVTYGVLNLYCIGCIISGVCLGFLLSALLSANGKDDYK